MAIKHTITQEVYTNSALISPVSGDESLRQFYWRRKNCYFNRNFEQKIMQMDKQLTYQCNVLDYSTMIELVTIDQNNRKTLYSYGPVKLQYELLTYPSLPAPQYPITIYLIGANLSATLAFEPAPSLVFLHLTLSNNRQITLRYPLVALHSGCTVFNLDAIPPNHMLLLTPEDQNSFNAIVQEMNLTTSPPKQLQISFEDHFTRDLCALQILIAMGYQFEGVRFQNTLKLWKTHYRYQNQQTTIDRLNDTHLECQLNGLFTVQQEQEPLPTVPRQVATQTINQFEHILDSPKGNNRESLKNFNAQKFEHEFLNGHRTQDSDFHKMQQSSSSIPKKKTAKRSNIAPMKWEQNTGKKQTKIDLSSFPKNDDPFLRQKYIMSLKRNQQLEMENRNLRRMNNDLMIKLRESEKKNQKKKEIPGFIKQLEINKAIKKAAHHFQDEPLKKSDLKKRRKSSELKSEGSLKSQDSRKKTWNNISKIIKKRAQSLESYSPPSSEKGKLKQNPKQKLSTMKSLGKPVKFFLNFLHGKEKGQRSQKGSSYDRRSSISKRNINRKPKKVNSKKP